MQKEPSIMLRFLGKLGVLAVLVVAGSYFLGWFTVTSSNDEQRTVIQVAIDRERVREHKTIALQRLDAFVRLMENKVDSALE
jgi:Na+/H+ antiporter NhaB